MPLDRRGQLPTSFEFGAICPGRGGSRGRWRGRQGDQREAGGQPRQQDPVRGYRSGLLVVGCWLSCESTMDPGRTWLSTAETMCVIIAWPVPYLGKFQSHGSTSQSIGVIPSCRATLT